MIGPSCFYAPVYLKKEPAICWLINKSFKEKFLEAIAYYRIGITSRTLGDVAEFHCKKKQQDLSWNKVIESLSVLSHLPEKTILTNLEFDRFSKDKILAPSELFKHPQSLNCGSSRHAVLGPLELKGVGRNCIAVREDYLHTWGGMSKNHALLGFLNGEILSTITPLGTWRTVMINRYLNYDSYFIARERPTVRASFFSNTLWSSRDDRDALKKSITLRQGENSPKYILDQNLAQLRSSFLDQWIHLSPTFENFSVEGSLIDLESVFVPLEKSTGLPVWFNLKFQHGSKLEKPSNKSGFISILEKAKFSFIRSYISDYVKNQIFRMESYFQLFGQPFSSRLYFKGLDKKLRPISHELSDLVTKLAQENVTKKELVRLIKNHAVVIKDFIELPGYTYIVTIALYIESKNEFREKPIFSTRDLASRWQLFDDEAKSGEIKAENRYQQFQKLIFRQFNL